jgi:hypothetical protein
VERKSSLKCKFEIRDFKLYNLSTSLRWIQKPPLYRGFRYIEGPYIEVWLYNKKKIDNFFFLFWSFHNNRLQNIHYILLALFFFYIHVAILVEFNCEQFFLSLLGFRGDILKNVYKRVQLWFDLVDSLVEKNASTKSNFPLYRTLPLT